MSQKALAKSFDNMQEGFALHEIIEDKNGKVIDYEILEANPAFEKITGLKLATIARPNYSANIARNRELLVRKIW